MGASTSTPLIERMRKLIPQMVKPRENPNPQFHPVRGRGVVPGMKQGRFQVAFLVLRVQ